jgi:L-alanine-DL-glutamate epimerase-like enolase superfamily enzyme
MRITRLRAGSIEVGPLSRFANQAPIRMLSTVLVVETDEGASGVSMPWSPRVAGPPLCYTYKHWIEPAVVGRDPFDREAINDALYPLIRGGLPLTAIGGLDVALWDLAGRALGQPIYRVMGAHRHAIPAYASTLRLDSIEAYADHALELIDQGFRAIKIHPKGSPTDDIEICRAVRAAVGDDYPLMLDPVAAYDRAGALRVGRALDELGFVWFEEPLVDTDIDGYVELCRALDLPVAGIDSVRWRLADYTEWLRRGAFDIVRGDAARHGLTLMRKIGVLAEAFDLKCEPHGMGPLLAQAANLHSCLAMPNCDWVEIPVPMDRFTGGVLDALLLQPDGTIAAPKGPGLGLEVDWPWIERECEWLE